MKILARKILAIGDIHGHTFWKKYARNISTYNKMIFMGDYVDQWPPLSSAAILKNFKEIIGFAEENKDKVVLLYGNHEFQYFNLLRYHCPGFRPDYENQVKELLIKNKSLFKMAYQAGNTLFTHAGLIKGYWQSLKKNPELNNINFNISAKRNYADILNDIFNYNANVFWSITPYRRGLDAYGSCIWADIREFTDKVSPGVLNSEAIISGLNQVMGHQPIPEIKKYSDITEKTWHTWIDTYSWKGSEVMPVLEVGGGEV